MKLLEKSIVGLLLCGVFNVGEAGAAAKVTITPTSEGVYSVSVADVAKAAAIDFTIVYDKEKLSNPIVVAGPFATAAKAISVPYNDSGRGALRVVYVVSERI